MRDSRFLHSNCNYHPVFFFMGLMFLSYAPAYLFFEHAVSSNILATLFSIYTSVELIYNLRYYMRDYSM
jgi:hypothetical protein